MSRRAYKDRMFRKVFGLANNKSYAITLPIDVVKSLGIQFGDELQLEIMNKKIIIQTAIKNHE